MIKTFLIIFFCCLVFACQKGIHWDIASSGSLVKDNDGNCLPVLVSGNYIADSTINDNNFITVDVNVTSTGRFNIFTDSINGYVFKASGEFNSIGVHHVKLLCSGKPVAAGTNYFIIHFDTSICGATVIVKSNTTPAAVFSLQGAPGKCLNDTVTGTFVKGTALDTSYKVNISVNVTSPGRYDIATAVVNGYSFTATGTFATAGVQTISMYPKGTPEKEGTDTFNITADSSSCSLEVKVISDEAKFTLVGAPGKCMDDTVIGTYVKGIFLDTFSKVNVNVNVTTPGRYNITTNSINGYSFTALGIFVSTGVQTITLYAQGTPLNSGTDAFNVTAGTSACSFEVNVLSGFVAVTRDDYFPLTDSSYWIYDDLFYKGNSIKTTINGSSSVNDKVYNVMEQTDGYGINSQYLFRRDGADYLEYAREDKYTGSFQYAKTIFAEFSFLNQNVQQGNYWETPEFKDVSTFNQVIILKYGYKCLKSNAVVTVNGKVFANVCIIEMRPQIRALENPWGYTNEVYTYYYAKGVGLIYYKAVSNYNFTKAEMQLKNWLVK
jgi:hypothetical protein